MGLLQRYTRRAAAVIALASGLAISTPALANTLSFESEAGDPVGQGQSRTFSESVVAVSQFTKRAVQVTVQTPDGTFDLFIGAPAGRQLVPGVYEVARYETETLAALTFSGNGRSCSTIMGIVVIDAVNISTHGYVETFDATWEQYCDGFASPLRGAVSIHNPPPPPELELTVDADSRGFVDKAGVATISGSLKCSVPASASFLGSLSQRPGQSSKGKWAFAYFDFVIQCIPGGSRWSARIVGSEGGLVPFSHGDAELEFITQVVDPNWNVHLSRTVNSRAYLEHEKRAEQ